MLNLVVADSWTFLPTPSARRATMRQPHPLRRAVISTHALREEGDPSWKPSTPRAKKFLPTPSARRATQRHGAPVSPMCYFYPRPPRGGRQDG